MAKTTGELFHSAKKKKRRKTKKKKVLYDTNSNAFLTIPFLTPYNTPSLQKQLTCAREEISYDQPHSRRKDGKEIISETLITSTNLCSYLLAP